MGNSATAIIRYGYIFEEEHEFPWKDDDVESWWQDRLGFVNPVPREELFTEDGWHADTFTDERCDEYFDNQREFMKNNPVPFELEMFGHYDYTQYCLVVPGSGTVSDWGPIPFDPSTLVLDNEKLVAFERFMEESELREQAIGTAGWIVGPYYG